MKRDFDLIRAILLEAESIPAGSSWIQNIHVEGYDAPTVAEHVKLMAEEGLIEASVASVRGAQFAIGGLTWSGHDFLDDARNETVWKEAKKRLGEIGGTASAAVFKLILTEAAKRIFGV